MFLLISKPQATLPDISKRVLFQNNLFLFSTPNHPGREPPVLNVREAFATLRVLFVWGFQGGLFFFHPALQTDTVLSTACAGHGAERKLAVLLLRRKYQFLYSQAT